MYKKICTGNEEMIAIFGFNLFIHFSRAVPTAISGNYHQFRNANQFSPRLKRNKKIYKYLYVSKAKKCGPGMLLDVQNRNDVIPTFPFLKENRLL